MSEGMAIAVRMRSTVMETANSTILKPLLRLRRVSENVALRPKVTSSFGRIAGIPAYAGGPNFNLVQLRGRGRLLASDAKHNAFIQERATPYYNASRRERIVTNRNNFWSTQAHKLVSPW